MKNKKKTRDTLQSEGLRMMDIAFEKQFGIKLKTEFNIIEQRYVSITEDAMTREHHAFLAGYSKALTDMFIAARL